VRAFPDDAPTLAAAERALGSFCRRGDLRRFRAALADSGIDGTALRYPFFFPTARRLARKFPRRLVLDWASFDDEDDLLPLLALLFPPEEAAWLRAAPFGARRALRAVAGRGRSDAVALLDRLDALPGDDFLREALHDRAAPCYLLAPGRGGPNRTTSRAPGAAIRFRRTPFARARPDLAAELSRPPAAVRAARGRAAAALVELARDAMAARARDLDCFAWGDPRDVRRFVHPDGLEFVAIGSLPERRLPLAAAYGLLTLRSGVPAGYVQLDGFLGTALVHFNVFPTFRGTDAAWVFARALATARALFGAESFAVEPYQLGHGNDEALASGAWWFYRKLGFAPKEPSIAALARREERRLRAAPGAQTPRATLARLARAHLTWEPFGKAATVPPDAALARAATAALASRPETAAAARAAVVRAAAALSGLDPRALSAGERLWLSRWAPLLVSLPGASTWTAAERRALGALVRAKAGRRESDLVPLARAHPRFGPALLELARRHGAEGDLRPRR
jgi:hypothetical protein